MENKTNSNTNNIIRVGTYNMNCDSNNDEVKITNTINNLINFIKTKEPIAIGLQNVNKKTIDAIEKLLNSFDDKYKIYSIYENDNNVISIIINTKITGIIVSGNIDYQKVNTLNDIYDIYGKMDEEIHLISLITNKGYLFVNINIKEVYFAPTDNKGSTDTKLKYIEDYNTIINEKKNIISKYIQEVYDNNDYYYKNNDNNDVVKINEIFIMGDFKDRFDFITEINLNENLILSYDAVSPQSCCGDINSSASNYRRIYIKEKYDDLKKKNRNIDYDSIHPYVIPDNTKQAKDINEEIKIKNYLFTGDKIFSLHGGILNIWNNNTDIISNNSNHELVFLEIIIIDNNTELQLNEPHIKEQKGGKTKKRRTNKNKKTKKNKPKKRKTNKK